MKKIFLIASLLIAFAGFGFAQTTPVAGPKKATVITTTVKPASTATTKVKSGQLASATKPVATNVATVKPATTGGPTKKDGTMDMRFKANKDAAKAPPAHLKADGTPDMRYKENKTKKTT